MSEIKCVYAVYRQGVYRHECVGIYSSRDAACKTADRMASLEADDYHTFEVFAHELDADPKLGELDWKGCPEVLEDDMIYKGDKWAYVDNETSE